MKRRAFKQCCVSGLMLLLVLIPVLCCCFTGPAAAAPVTAVAMPDHSAHCGGQPADGAPLQDASGCSCPHLFATQADAVKAVTADLVSFRFNLSAGPSALEGLACFKAARPANFHDPSPQPSSPSLFIRHHSLRI